MRGQRPLALYQRGSRGERTQGPATKPEEKKKPAPAFFNHISTLPFSISPHSACICKHISTPLSTLPYCKGSIKLQNIQTSKMGEEEHARKQENTRSPPNPVPPHAHMHAGEHAAHFALFFPTHSAHTMPVPMWDQDSKNQKGLAAPVQLTQFLPEASIRKRRRTFGAKAIRRCPVSHLSPEGTKEEKERKKKKEKTQARTCRFQYSTTGGGLCGHIFLHSSSS